jgi:hypothetical protein
VLLINPDPVSENKLLSARFLINLNVLSCKAAAKIQPLSNLPKLSEDFLENYFAESLPIATSLPKRMQRYNDSLFRATLQRKNIP